VLGIVAGGIGLLSPTTAAGALLLLISAYAIVAGVLMIWAGFKLREQIEREWRCGCWVGCRCCSAC
jgi:uncharacterized membrane protein HdeD (DUF308 family)